MQQRQCERCGTVFAARHIVEGKIRHFYDRRYCFACSPFRTRNPPAQKPPVRQPLAKRCEWCSATFPAKQVVDGRLRSLYCRRFCLNCSPFRAHNTAKRPPVADAHEGGDVRRVRRNRSIRRYQNRRRAELKSLAIGWKGGRCEDCGYDVCARALDFHHVNGADKRFTVSGTLRSVEKLRSEVANCVLVCATCHRLRHASESDRKHVTPKTLIFRTMKARAFEFMGRHCLGCGRDGLPAVMDFHHPNGQEKSFGISEQGIIRAWPKIEAELGKTVMLCANCHREVHAGVRRPDLRSSGVNAWQETDAS